MQTLSIKNPVRLDTALADAFPSLRGGRTHKYLRENKIKVNSKKVPLSTRLSRGDVVTVYLPDAALGLAAAGPLFLQARSGLRVLFENDCVLIVEKPAGLPTHDETQQTADTLLHRVLRHCYEAGSWTPENTFAPCLCHRLDTGTSGLVLLAKTVEAQSCLDSLLKERRIQKSYRCVTLRAPSPCAATLHAHLQKDASRGFVCITDRPAPGSKEIITQYDTLCVNGALALLSVALMTGRTHQIRAHLAHIGCPILGDSKYGDNAANRAYKAKYQALCAYSLTFPTLSGTPCDALSGRTFTANAPWYVEQMENGTLR